MQIINIADLIDPDDPQGRSYRQVNAERTHGIPVGTLVEVVNTGVRLFVVYQGRDCDSTPLYWLSPDRNDITRVREGFQNRTWDGGYSEDGLVVIRE
jgi:hypothetical protein